MYFVLDEQNAVLRIALIHGQAYYVGRTSLAAEDGAAFIYAIYNNKPGSQGNHIVSAVNDDSERDYVAYWKYPAGGNPLYELTHGIDKAVGVAISLKKGK
jgi:hypothetical protein